LKARHFPAAWTLIFQLRMARKPHALLLSTPWPPRTNISAIWTSVRSVCLNFRPEAGHVRLVYEVQSLPAGVPVVVDVTFEIRPKP
jgi:hypothetical protein